MDQPIPGSKPNPRALFLSAHARYAAYTAERCGYVFSSLDGADGYCFEVRNGARAALFAAGAGSPYALNDVRAASIARDKAFCALALQRAGVSVVPGRLFFTCARWVEMRSPGREPEDARAFARGADYPMFCKPISASNGLFAELIGSADGFMRYLERVSVQHFAVLAQPYIRAPEYRVFVLNGEPLFSYQKRLPQVVGDGARTVAELARAAGRVDIDDARVLGSGECLDLEGAANRATGGGASDLADGAPERLAGVALAAVAALGLRLAAVDLFDRPEGAQVIEVNSNPMIATLEDFQRWDLIEAIWRANFGAALR